MESLFLRKNRLGLSVLMMILENGESVASKKSVEATFQEIITAMMRTKKSILTTGLTNTLCFVSQNGALGLLGLSTLLVSFQQSY